MRKTKLLSLALACLMLTALLASCVTADVRRNFAVYRDMDAQTLLSELEAAEDFRMEIVKETESETQSILLERDRHVLMISDGENTTYWDLEQRRSYTYDEANESWVEAPAEEASWETMLSELIASLRIGFLFKEDAYDDQGRMTPAALTAAKITAHLPGELDAGMMVNGTAYSFGVEYKAEASGEESTLAPNETDNDDSLIQPRSGSTGFPGETDAVTSDPSIAEVPESFTLTLTVDFSDRALSLPTEDGYMTTDETETPENQLFGLDPYSLRQTMGKYGNITVTVTLDGVAGEERTTETYEYDNGLLRITNHSGEFGSVRYFDLERKYAYTEQSVGEWRISSFDTAYLVPERLFDGIPGLDLMTESPSFFDRWEDTYSLNNQGKMTLMDRYGDEIDVSADMTVQGAHYAFYARVITASETADVYVSVAFDQASVELPEASFSH